MKSEWSYSHGYGQSLYHVVLVPYRRKKIFKRGDIRSKAFELFYGIATEHRFTIHELEIVENHVHLFIDIRPTQSIAQIIQYLKGISSRYLRQVFPELKGYSDKYLWSKGKYYRPISDVSEETIRHYILESQGKHHGDVPNVKRLSPSRTISRRTSFQQSLDIYAC